MKSQITSEGDEVSISCVDTKRIRRGRSEQLYASKFGNLEEMDEFLGSASKALKKK